MNAKARLERIEAAAAEQIAAGAEGIACEVCKYPRGVISHYDGVDIVLCGCGRWLTPDGRPLADVATLQVGRYKAKAPTPLTAKDLERLRELGRRWLGKDAEDYRKASRGKDPRVKESS